ncbi:leucine-rich repeat extensin-like protein 3 [Iris pallida]|uniref:Leucine-rich repeat extensin-like protein 3 n=1 Tax=Iris pallida TaxID=29817 RepID=A0AAX6E818_IRIPA|nr:leucine-rich repeat extensin-like protein 3 [Iris pallida]
MAVTASGTELRWCGAAVSAETRRWSEKEWKSREAGNRGKLGLVSGGRRRWVLGGAGEKKRRGRLQAELDAADEAGARGFLRRSEALGAVKLTGRGGEGTGGRALPERVKGFRRRGHGEGARRGAQSGCGGGGRG